MASLINRAVLPASIIPTLESNSDLSILNKYINSSTKLFDLLTSANAFTFLAPSDDAFSQWIESQGNSTPTADVIEATLSYHLLNGSFPSVDFTDQPQFAPTNLKNQSYSNVTVAPSGQRVELITGSSGQPEFLSSNKSVSSVATKDIVCLGGLIHVVNSILSIPTSVVLLTAQANMNYFIAILNKANFLSLDDTGVIDFVNYASFTPNMTFFVPNSAAALATFSNVSSTLSADNLTALFDYHIVPNYVGYSPSLTNGTVLKTTQGSNLTITTQGSDIYVNSAKITNPDYLIVNGVIHVIDGLLDRFNATIPYQNSSTTTVTTSTTSSPSSLENAASSHSGTSKGTAIGVGVAVPIAFLAVCAGLLFWFLRRRRASRQAPQHELGADPASKELGTTPASKELPGTDISKELPGTEPAKELHASHPPTELYAPHQDRPPVELE